MTFVVRSLSDADVSWSDTDTASVQVGAGSYKRTVAVRPRPMYSHDINLVTLTLAEIEAAHPLVGSPGELTILDRDFVSGFNGYATPDAIYKKPDGSDWSVEIPCACGCGKPLKMQGLGLGITLAGKVVPQHPSWTRYLVGHEYGHCAWYHARRLLGWSMSDAVQAEREYMRVRGVDDWKDGKRWHQLAVEIIANDFRVLAGIEPNYWQHDVPQPGRGSPIAAWWLRARELSAQGHPGDLT